jgi:hypothetical protein
MNGDGGAREHSHPWQPERVDMNQLIRERAMRILTTPRSDRTIRVNGHVRGWVEAGARNAR